jgi:hypothetical protein
MSQRFVNCAVILTTMVFITYSQRSHKYYRKYKSENGTNTDQWIYQWWDQVPKRSKRPLSTSHTRRKLDPVNGTICSHDQEWYHNWYKIHLYLDNILLDEKLYWLTRLL